MCAQSLGFGIVAEIQTEQVSECVTTSVLPAHLQQKPPLHSWHYCKQYDIVDILVQQDALVEGYKKYCLLTEVSTNLGEV